MRHMIAKSISLGALMIGTVLAIPLEQQLAGYSVLAFGSLVTLYAEKSFRRHILLLFGSLAILALAPINTDIDLQHMTIMGLILAAAVGLPFYVTRYIYKEKIIEFPIARHTWTRAHIGYLVLAAVLSYLLLPFWMQSTGAYQNWSVELSPGQLGVLFIGTNGLGIWDELFFIITCLALLRKHVPFWVANLIQAVLFTAFLYELGFRGWAPFLIYPFALLQGEVFRRTQNLVYIIAIHLTIDFVLYLALINAHYPDVLNIFITR